jgi:hypothetical protein
MNEWRTSWQETYTGVAVDVLTDFSADIDLATLAPEGTVVPRQITILAAGAGSVLSIVDLAGRTRSLPADALVKYPLNSGVRTILSATNVTSLLVIW